MTPPEQLGPYRIEAELGRGAMGVVYRARDTRVDRLVAIKLVLTDAEAQARRFEIEARAAGRLRHKNLVGVHDLAREGQRLYLVSEFVQGRSLQDHLKERGRFEPDQAVELVARLCEGVEHAHQAGVLHRDIKPENVLLEGDEPRLTDFGLARLEASDMTRTGELLGTPSYMPPEQASGERERIDARCDVYALGATLYALLTGRAPFAAGSVVATITALLTKPVPPPSEFAPISSELEDVVLTALAKEPEGRFQSAAAFGAALRDWQAGIVNENVKKRHKSAKARVIGAGLVIVLVATGLGALALASAKSVPPLPPTSLTPFRGAAAPSPSAAPEEDPWVRAAALWNDPLVIDGDAALVAYTALAQRSEGRPVEFAYGPLGDILVAGNGSEDQREAALAVLTGGSKSARLPLARVLTRGRSASLELAQPLCWELAEEGETTALLLLGDLYRTVKNKEQAEVVYQRAHGARNPEAGVRLGQFLLAKRKRKDEGVNYLEAADREGVLSGTVALGYAYARGKGVLREPSRAAQLFDRAAKAGSADALYALGRMVEVEQPDDGIVYFRRAVKLGHAKAATSLAKQLRAEGGTPAEILGLLRFAASRGDEEAQVRLALFFIGGEDGVRDVEGGLALLERDGQRGNVRAETELASQLAARGEIEGARASWRRLAERGKPRAMSLLGHSLLTGSPSPAQIKEASELLHKASRRKVSQAAITLGEAYQRGPSGPLGLPRDYSEALKHYDYARQAKDPRAGVLIGALQAKIKREAAAAEESKEE